jgi:hypothetical protein
MNAWFRDDSVIKKSSMYSLFIWLYFVVPSWFNALEVVGTVPPPDTGVLYIALHSTHLLDVAIMMTALYKHTGRVVHVLMHRIFFYIMIFFWFVGIMPGYPEYAEELLEKKMAVLVLPGGAEEFLYGHEHAYDLHPKWNSRFGFVRVSRKTNAKIVPVFLKNCEEVRFNAILWLANRLKLYRIYDYLMEIKILAPWVLMFATALLFYVNFFGVLLPVKLTLYIGDPVECDFASESDQVINQRCQNALKNMMLTHQNQKFNYGPAIRERIKVHKEYIQGLSKSTVPSNLKVSKKTKTKVT